ncbi:hypothetical protein AVXHC19_29990 [Acidovorax sacchari]
MYARGMTVSEIQAFLVERYATEVSPEFIIWLSLRNITVDWGRAAHNWKEAMNQFAILYEERFTRTAL